MNAWINHKSLLTLVLLGAVVATSGTVEAAAPWFRPGALRPLPRDSNASDRSLERRRESENERRRLYSEEGFVRQLYAGFMNRQPSAQELRHWTGRLGRDAGPTDLVQEFMESDEFFVRQTCRGLLGRDPNPDGLMNYMQALRDGWSRAEVIEAYLTSDEFRGRLRPEPLERRRSGPGGGLGR